MKKMGNTDLINREELFEKLNCINLPVGNKTVDKIFNVIENMPSTEPEIIRCKDCKHHWTHRCMDSMPTEICELDQTFYDANVDFCSLAERRTDG